MHRLRPERATWQPVAVVSTFDQLRAAREEGTILVLDGAMGTELESRGVPMDDDAWCGLANLRQPELVRAIHEDHIRAGADVVITNTFMSGLGPMQRAGAGESFTAGIDNAVCAARQAVQAVAERPVAIAGSIGTTPWGAPQAAGGARLRDGYARQVDLLTEGGVDVIALEMVTDVDLAVPALEAALASGLPVWLGLSMQVAGRDDGEYDSLPDIDGARAVAEACLTTELDAVTVMHTDIDDVAAAQEMLASLWSGAVGVYPHHGRWRRPHWEFVDVDPPALLELARAWVALGAGMLGGCCGLQTRHVAALRAAVDSGAFA
jgi:S-methylmethionine-dependent homocysteine/selenocysteine methylase